MRKEISSIKKNVLVAEKASANARVELEAAESKLLLVEGEPVLGDDPLKMKRLRTTVEKTGEAELSLRESLEVKEALLNRLSLKPRYSIKFCFLWMDDVILCGSLFFLIHIGSFGCS